MHTGPHPLGWQPLGAADFNLDGTTDVAWYNPTTNNIDIWLLNNGQWMESANIGSHPGVGPGASLPPAPALFPRPAPEPGLVVAVGVGDFDHNGVNDVMWHDTSNNRIDNWMLAFN